MNNRHLALCLRELVHQKELATVAASHLNDAIAATGEDARAMNVRLLGAAQGILTAAAQISKLLYADTLRDWSDERVKFALDRAKAVRAVVQPGEILQRRSVRNSVEHYDARLDDALFAEPGALIVDANVSPKRMIVAPGAIWLRNLDPESLTYSALDAEVSLRDLYRAIEEVAGRAQAWLDTHP